MRAEVVERRASPSVPAAVVSKVVKPMMRTTSPDSRSEEEVGGGTGDAGQEHALSVVT